MQAVTVSEESFVAVTALGVDSTANAGFPSSTGAELGNEVALHAGAEGPAAVSSVQAEAFHRGEGNASEATPAQHGSRDEDSSVKEKAEGVEDAKPTEVHNANEEAAKEEETDLEDAASDGPRCNDKGEVVIEKKAAKKEKKGKKKHKGIKEEAEALKDDDDEALAEAAARAKTEAVDMFVCKRARYWGAVVLAKWLTAVLRRKVGEASESCEDSESGEQRPT